MLEKILAALELIAEKLDILIEQSQNPTQPNVEEDDLLGTAAKSKDKPTQLDDVLAAINDNVKRIGGDDKAKSKVRGVLEKFGAKRGSEVKEDDFTAVIEALGKLKK